MRAPGLLISLVLLFMLTQGQQENALPNAKILTMFEKAHIIIKICTFIHKLFQSRRRTAAHADAGILCI